MRRDGSGTGCSRAPDGPVPVLHRGPHALYLDLDGSCARRASPRARCRCRARCIPVCRSCPPTASPGVEGGVLHLDDVPLRIGRVTRPATSRRSLRSRLGALRAEVGRAGRRRGRAHAVRRRRAVRLAGGAPGRRPRHGLVDEAVRDRLHRTTSLSAALLDCAMHGEVVPEFATYVGALGTPREEQSTAALRAIGHTSGAGLLQGAEWALAA